MNLRNIANSASSVINPNITVSVKISTGSTVGAGRKQVPSYANPVTAQAQLQALDGDDLKQIDGLNIQGTLRAIYLYDAVTGVVRPDMKGGDLITINDKDWLVVRVLESWPTWTKACIVLQQND